LIFSWQSSGSHPVIIARFSLFYFGRVFREEVKTLDRALNHATPLEATQHDAHEVKKDRDKFSQDSLAQQQQQAQTQIHPDPAPTKTAELEIEGPELDLGLIL